MNKQQLKVVALTLALALGIGFGAGTVFAKKDKGDGSLSLTVFEVQSLINKDYTIEVDGDGGVSAVLVEQGREVHRLSVEGGKGLVSNGTLSDGDSVRVVGNDKKHKHRGHVTILK